jgi:hypothetical protein
MHSLGSLGLGGSQPRRSDLTAAGTVMPDARHSCNRIDSARMGILETFATRGRPVCMRIVNGVFAAR